MITLILFRILLLLPFIQSAGTAMEPAGNGSKPNLLIIQTDEHSFRTLGCYRKQLTQPQAYVWGEGINVETPNIDYLAENGVLFTKFYAATPVCSPSRSSLISGLYPQHTGVPVNDVPMTDGLITYSEVLKKAGYKTGFIGKWHLDGEGKPQWSPERKFGFDDNRYMYNRGHWKKLEDTPEGPRIATLNQRENPDISADGADEKSFTTDFLADRAIEFIGRNKEIAFSLYLSLPDPHGPDKVRAPYNTMYTGLNFKAPASYYVVEADAPAWAKPEKNAETDHSQYFGMVKCIDDNVGKIVNYLREKQLLEKTIIVFTSDHGDLRAEHHRHNKGNPFEASAKVPFIVYYPSKIPGGSVIRNAFNTVDFTPTILNFMGQDVPVESEGRDFSDLLVNPQNQNEWEDITFLRSTGLADAGNWVAAVTSRYKLVLSKNDVPWLIDIEEDPDELINFASNPEKAAILKILSQELKKYGNKHSDPFLDGTKMALDLKKLIPD